jgi:hypothetical protein
MGLNQNTKRLSPAQAGRVSEWVIRMTNTGAFTPETLQVAHNLLWKLGRKWGEGELVVSLRRIVETTGRCKATVVKAIEALCQARILTKVKERVRVWDPILRIRVSRQATNRYVFRVPHTESARQTVYNDSLPTTVLTSNTHASAPPLAEGLAAALERLAQAARLQGLTR